jgi:tRNA G37 N-methylase Trm5
VEGLVKGAQLNKFSLRVVNPSYADRDPTNGRTQIILMPFPNQDCLPVFRSQADIVNLGLLPDALEGLPVAVDALKNTGGVLRIHGEVQLNMAGKARCREEWAEGLVELLQEHAKLRWQDFTRDSIQVQAIMVVKSLSKDLEHCIADVIIQP